MEGCESARLKNYIVDRRFLYEAKVVTQGTQKKYFDGQYYYKLDKVGNEGLCEYLAYTLLQYSDIDKKLIIEYERCTINGIPGCRSKNFLERNETFVTMDTIYRNLTGRMDLTDRLLSLQDAKKRLEFILELASDFGIDRKVYRDYLNSMMQLDLLVGNVDRHTHNYGIIVNNADGAVRLPPLFDNGRSLNTDRADGNACTLSGSFMEQVTVFGYPIRPMFSISIKEIIAKLGDFDGVYEYEQLKSRLAEYGEIWDKTGEVNIF